MGGWTPSLTKALRDALCRRLVTYRWAKEQPEPRIEILLRQDLDVLSDVFRLHGVQVCDKEVSVNLFNSKSCTSQTYRCVRRVRVVHPSFPSFLFFRTHYTTPLTHCAPMFSLRDLNFFAS